VDKAWDYWEKQGVVRKKGDQREFVVLKSSFTVTKQRMA
jgi:hypothetical protein